jgi:hypothetical protein
LPGRKASPASFSVLPKRGWQGSLTVICPSHSCVPRGVLCWVWFADSARAVEHEGRPAWEGDKATQDLDRGRLSEQVRKPGRPIARGEGPGVFGFPPRRIGRFGSFAACVKLTGVSREMSIDMEDLASRSYSTPQYARLCDLRPLTRGRATTGARGARESRASEHDLPFFPHLPNSANQTPRPFVARLRFVLEFSGDLNVGSLLALGLCLLGIE